MTVTAAHPLWWKDYLVQKVTPAHVEQVLGLVNPPAAPDITNDPSGALPPLQQHITVTFTTPPGMTHAAAVLLAPDHQPFSNRYPSPLPAAKRACWCRSCVIGISCMWIGANNAYPPSLFIVGIDCFTAFRGGDSPADLDPAGGRTLIRLENPYLQLDFDPKLGARGVVLIDKATGKGWLFGREAREGGGLFMDHFWEQNWPGEFLFTPYQAEIVPTADGSACVRFRITATGVWGQATLPLLRVCNSPALSPCCRTAR